MKYRYTEKQYKELLTHMVILVDTREQNNQPILDWFDKHNIKYKNKALKTGDYNFYIEKCEELGYMRDTYFTDDICIEKKNSVNELAGNFASSSKDDGRFSKELNRMINIPRNYLLIENNTLDDIFEHGYESKLNEQSFLRTLLTWQARNSMHIFFVSTDYLGELIYELCKNCLDATLLK